MPAAIAGSRPVERLNATAIRTTASERYALACLATVFAVAGVFIVNPHSIAHFVYYFFLWSAFIAFFHPEDTKRFAFAFLVNSAFVAVFFVVQTSVYPDSYGTTSPLGSWTDDSHFFSLLADEIPANLLVRDQYFEYSDTFTTLIRILTPLPIVHPLDAIFFQSGTAALLATFSRRLALQTTADRHLADVVFAFVVVCPFLMMNGGLILIRDTFAAALLAYTLSSLLDGRYLLAFGAVLLQLAVRPGTGLILVPVILIVFLGDIQSFVRRHPVWAPVALIGIPLGLASLGATFWEEFVSLAPDLFADVLLRGATIALQGREIFEDLAAVENVNRIFLAIQDLPLLIKVVLNACYMFLYPFLSPRILFDSEYFDLRTLAMNLVIPVYAIWLNAWFIAGAIGRSHVASRQRNIVAAFAIGLILIGTYSLQTRHKTILYPLYYIVVAIGLCRSSPAERRVGYWCSAMLTLLQIVFAFR